MARLIKDGAVVQDDWTRLGADFDTGKMDQRLYGQMVIGNGF